MNIPLDRLYHYIESVAQRARGDDVLIYRFSPHGSKKIEDLTVTREVGPVERFILPNIYCNDQEPLDYDFYDNQITLFTGKNGPDFVSQAQQANIPLLFSNLRRRYYDIYDRALVLHSEQRSANVELYNQNQFITVYYWSHAIIARDWFRYAQHITPHKIQPTKKFLIYNRAWSGAREYRLKFSELLIKENLVNDCKISFNAVEPELKIHYTQHQYKNSQWIPDIKIEDFIDFKPTKSCYSADFDISDYDNTDFEIVLETLFDDNRLHLTEKSLRPIACGQPFILCATYGSLEYLRKYGFKTFGDIIDESYDNIKDPYHRMLAIINVMKSISSWTQEQQQANLIKIQSITDHNQQHFFSDVFFNHVVDELEINFSRAFKQLESTNTSKPFIDLRKQLARSPENRAVMTKKNTKDIQRILTQARTYYNRYLKTLNK
jgi:hypothetical protein